MDSNKNPVYPAGTWSGGLEQYSNGSSSYARPASQSHTRANTVGNVPFTPATPNMPYHSGYFVLSPAFSPNTGVGHPPEHPPTLAGGKHEISYSMDAYRPTPLRSGSHPYMTTHANSHTNSPPQSRPSRQRSASHSNSLMPPHGTPSLVPQQNNLHSLPQSPTRSSVNVASTQYPSSPSRPFACDMCALSFSRHHDLRRHRDTHTGDKPYSCNGGCGKTFTRKDALKRHQVVKGCGKVEEPWS